MSEEVRMDPSTTQRRRRQRIVEPQAGPSSSQPLHSPIKKRKSTILSVGEKTIVLNVFKHTKNTWPENEYRSNMAMVNKTAEITGISKSAIYGILREYKDTHELKPKGTTKNKLGIIQKLDSFDKTAIRQKVHRFFMEGDLPTIDKIQQKINEDDTLPNFSKTTLRRVLKHLKFKFQKRNRKSALIERPEIILWRTKYLKEMEGYRNENRNIYYLDETWVNAGHTVAKAWTDTTVTSSRQAFLEGLSTGAKNPTGKGSRLIVVHIGNENGFLDDCQWVFVCKKTGDYHEAMDAVHFEEWFAKVLDKLQPNDVVVMDNASYHSRRLEKIPTSSWRKQQIMDWLQDKEIIFDQQDTKAHLMVKVQSVKSFYQKYAVDEMAKEKGVLVLRLPPYHCELNPIELVWADTKSYVARHNTTFKLTDVKKLFNDALNQVTPEKWKNCVEYVKKEEVKMKGLDHQIDKTADRFIISVTDTSESESSVTENTDTDSPSEFSV